MLRRDIEALKVGSEGLTRAFAIYDENDQQAIVKQIMKRMGLDTKQLTPRTVLGRISWAKNHMVDPQEYYLASKDPNSERIAHIYQGYQAELRKNNALDFDDLLLEAVRLLKVSGEARERYQRRYRYLLVDEYQDTNRPQYELMKLLAGERKNVCAVGDEDQSIYSWRGADIRNILEFEKDFPNARIVRLEQNYRSTQVILEAAGAVVANNLQAQGQEALDRPPGRLADRLLRGPRRRKRGALHRRPHPEVSARGRSRAARRTRRIARCSTAPTRSRGWWRRRCAATTSRYTMVGGFSFYERAEIKDLLGYLRLIRNPHDSMALQRVINTPARGIGKTTLETLERLALETGASTWDALGAAIANRLIPTRALMAHRVLPPADSRRAGHDGPGLCRQARGRRGRRRGIRAMPTPASSSARLRRTQPARSPPPASTSAAARTSFRCSTPASFSPFAAASKRPFLDDAEADCETAEPRPRFRIGRRRGRGRRKGAGQAPFAPPATPPPSPS